LERGIFNGIRSIFSRGFHEFVLPISLRLSFGEA
jgi:hypothetical protein